MNGVNAPATAADPAVTPVSLLRLHTADIEPCGYCGRRVPIRHAVRRDSAPDPGGEGEANVCAECLARGYRFLCERFVPRRRLPERAPRRVTLEGPLP